MKIPANAAHFPDQLSMGSTLCAKLEALTFEYGQYHDSYIVNEPYYEYFWGAGEREWSLSPDEGDI